MTRSTSLAVAAAALVLATTACGGAATGGGDGPDDGITDYALMPADPATTEIRVAFTDSSVPPEYHRSWVLTADRDEITLVVDSYGDVVARERVDTPPPEWKQLMEDLASDLPDIEDPPAADAGCTGGTSIELEVDGAGSYLTRTVGASPCGDNEVAERTMEQIEDLVAPLADAVRLKALVRT